MVDVFLARREEFGIFVTYIGGYDRSMALLEESCRRNKAFADVIKRFEVRTGCEFSGNGTCRTAISSYTSANQYFKSKISFEDISDEVHVYCIVTYEHIRTWHCAMSKC